VGNDRGGPVGSEREHWFDVEVDDDSDDQPPEAVAGDDVDDDDVELHGQFFE
jgi:hypothetical protein